ncbi:MAG: reactive intermediate/imine deaminase [Alphaproteobacteria bacterium HGW-Alphaproteobacteria-6]|nr:MAG: reactive intermediate/imine deaminase [Alphaproteobacteria bacterium HGW-Alphaproteobacteria-6]
MRDATITTISTPNAPVAAGHYAQAIRHAGLVYISGQLPVAPDGSHHPEADFDEQARQAIRNLISVAECVGASVADLLKVTAYIVDVANWPRFNAVYAQMLGDARPARTVVPVPELHYGYLVEIDAVAACKN